VAQQQQEEPPKSDYERRRDEHVAKNDAMLAALGLKTIAAEISNSLPQSANDKGKKSANKKTSSEGSDTSEYLLENDDQGDSDDDETESVVRPQPTKSPPGYSRKIITRRIKKASGPNMPPGGRSGKRVRAPEGSQPEPPSAQLRSSKRLQLSAIDGQPAEEGNGSACAVQGYGAGAQQGNGAGGDDIAAAENDNGAADQDMATVHEDNVAAEDDTQAPAQRRPRDPRPPTKGAYLDKMTKAMGHRLPIAVAPGKRRPHEPVQAAKFASESGVLIRDNVPILPHWKNYKNDEKYYNEFVSKLCGRLAINKTDEPTKEACTDMLRSSVRQMRYRLKKKYFNGVPANEVRTSSPVSCMSDDEWNALTAKWKNPKNMETSEKNKTNRSKVKYHQTTGSRSYVAHLHAYKKQSNNAEPSTHQNEELDVVEAFKTCHTSSKKGLDESAREALSNMEALRAAPVDEGETAVSSVQVVSQALPKNSSNSFLKNIGIKPTTSSKSAALNESDLREQLAAEARAVVQGELDALKKKSEEADEKLERQQKEMEEMRKQTEINQKELQETNVLLRRMLSLNNAST